MPVHEGIHATGDRRVARSRRARVFDSRSRASCDQTLTTSYESAQFVLVRQPITDGARRAIRLAMNSHTSLKLGVLGVLFGIALAASGCSSSASGSQSGVESSKK